MTKEEFDALPEWETRFGQRLETQPDGSKVIYPVAPKMVAFHTTEDDWFIYFDENGDEWCTGWYEGKRYKMRRPYRF